MLKCRWKMEMCFKNVNLSITINSIILILACERLIRISDLNGDIFHGNKDKTFNYLQ